MPEWFTAIEPDLISNTFTAIVNVLSVIGFVITIFVMLGVRQIKGHYTSRIRVPELKDKVVSLASQLGTLLNDYKNNKNHIELEIARIGPVLKAIKKRLSWTERNKVNETLKLLKKHESYGCNEERTRTIYNLLHGISAELEQWENDKKWS